MSFEDMAKQFTNRTPVSLQKKAVKLGLKSGFRHKDHSHNINYWNTPTIESSFFAGFIAADGNLNSKKKVLTLSLNSKDLVIIEQFKNAVDFTGEIRTYERLKYHSTEMMSVSTLTISGCGKWYEDLKDIYNITPAKTFTLLPPNITDENLIWAYITGFLSGDGWISNKIKGGMRLGFVNASEALLVWIKKQLDKKFPLCQQHTGESLYSKINKHPTGNYYQYYIEGVRAATIFDYLSNVRVPKLARKFENPEVLKIVAQYKEKYPQHFLPCKL